MTNTFSPFEIVGGKVQLNDESIQVIELAHLDPEAIPAATSIQQPKSLIFSLVVSTADKHPCSQE